MQSLYYEPLCPYEQATSSVINNVQIISDNDEFDLYLRVT